MIKYPVRKTLEKSMNLNGISFDNFNTYSIDLTCNIDIPCDDGADFRFESESVHITLHPSYDKRGNYNGTMVNCLVGRQYRYRGLRKGIREYDWKAVLEMFPRLTFRNKSRRRVYYNKIESFTGAIIKDYHIESASFVLKVVYDNFGPKIKFMVNGLRSISGIFSFIIEGCNELKYTLDCGILQNDSCLFIHSDTNIDVDLQAAFEDHNIALSICENYMDNYIKEQHWSSCLEL